MLFRHDDLLYFPGRYPDWWPKLPLNQSQENSETYGILNACHRGIHSRKGEVAGGCASVALITAEGAGADDSGIKLAPAWLCECLPAVNTEWVCVIRVTRLERHSVYI